MGFTPVAVVATIGLIVFGTTTSLFGKIVYDLKGVDEDGDLKYFRKPWAMTLVMFVGMTFCLPIAYIYEGVQKAKQKKEGLEKPLIDGEGVEEHSEWKKILALSIPTIFDLIATVLMNVGLLSVTASVYQMMRGAEMLFAALFAVVFLQRKLNNLHYYGLACCTAGIALVGMSSILSGEGSLTVKVSKWQMAIGMMLIVASQCVQAAQITFEDFFMTDMNIAPMKIVGFEGFFGCILMVLIMMPIAYFIPGQDGHGLHEDTLNTIYMLGHNPHILGVIIFMAFALLMYNISGMNVTGELGAVFRTVLETMRTLFVWLIDLLLHEGLGLQEFGESWSNWSYLQAVGFVVLVSGTIIYGKGDDKDVQEVMKETLGEDITGTSPVSITGRTPTAPIAVSAGSVTKSTLNMNFYAGSLRHSYTAGSATPRLREGSQP